MTENLRTLRVSLTRTPTRGRNNWVFLVCSQSSKMSHSIFIPQSLLQSAFPRFWRGTRPQWLMMERIKDKEVERWWLHLSLQKVTYINVLRLQSPEVWAWILLNQRRTRTAACVSSLLWFHLEKHRNERHLFNMSLPLSSKSPTERKLTETLAEDQCRGRVVGRHFKQTRPGPEVQKENQEEGRLGYNCTK